MPKVRLFGIDGLNVPLQNTPIGNLANTLDLKLSSDQKSLSIKFNGAHPLGAAVFDVSVPCTLSGDLISLSPGSTSGPAASLLLTLPFELGQLQLAPATFVSDAGELAFRDSTSVLRDGLKKINLVQDLIALDWASDQSWSNFGFTIDFALSTATFFPVKERRGEMIVADILGPALREQFLGITRTTVSASNVVVVARPRDGILWVHPDALSAAANTDNDHEFLYQHGLVNGALTVTLSGDAAGSRRTYEWRALQDSARHPGLLVCRLQDEHGHPLLLETATGEGFVLAVRVGVQNPHDDSSTDAHWELTNVAMLVHGSSAGDEPTKHTPVLVTSIDPLKVDVRFGDPERRWLSDDDVVTKAGTPVEIHGLAKGVVLRRSATGPIQGRLQTFPITHPTDGHIYTQTDLVLNNAGEWTLITHREERDVLVGTMADVNDRPIGHLLAPGMNGKELVLPAIDTSYALANLADDQGRVKEHHILKSAIPWLQGHDAQFTGDAPAAFAAPSSSNDTHVSGFGIVPKTTKTPFHSIIDMPPGSAREAAATARTGAVLNPLELHYIHGGVRTDKGHDDLFKALDGSRTSFDEPYQRFLGFWSALTLSGTDLEARDALRKELSLSRPRLRERSEFKEMWIAAREVLYGGRQMGPRDRSSAASPEEGAAREFVKTRIPKDISLETFTDLWTDTAKDPAKDPLVSTFLDLLGAGTGTSVYRRVLRRQLQDDPGTAAVQKKLKELISLPNTSTTVTPPGELPGFPMPIISGMDEALAIVSDVWAALPELEEFRFKFGHTLTIDVYVTLTTRRDVLDEVLRRYVASTRFATDLANTAFAHLRSEIEERWNHSEALKALRTAKGLWKDTTLAALTAVERAKFFAAVVDELATFVSRLRADPPEYLFFSARIATSQTPEARKFSSTVWNHLFRLASLGGPSAWAFLLDSESSIIVKLTGNRDIAQILTEVSTAYATAGHDDPLGLRMSPQQFGDMLDPDLRSPLWRGVLVVRPTADIERDEQLKTLAGLTHIPMLYAAIGGAKPETAGDDVDVYARIHHERSPQEVEGTPPEDLTLTLIKFDATIRNTRLVAGEVIFRLDIRNTFGRDTRDTNQFPVLRLRGTVARDKKAEGNSFEFSAWFEKPITYPIKVAFIESFVFKALRVTTSRGQTSVDIDAGVNLRSFDGFPAGPDDGKPSLLNLQNFRILIPRLKPGAAIPMGLARLLNFELPAVSFTWPNPRPLTLLNGIELLPIGLGFLRSGIRPELPEFAAFVGRYQWLSDSAPDGKNLLRLPYLRCEIHFGKLPVLGGTNMSRLSLELVLAVLFEEGGNPDSPKLAIGIGGVDASNISIDLFGIIKVELERLKIGQFSLMKADGTKANDAVAIIVDNPRLTILGWSPLAADQKLQFLLAHAARQENGRAVLGFYSGKPSSGFFRLHWLLVAHNFVLHNDDITRYLVGRDILLEAGQAHNLLNALVDTTKNRINATISEDDSWLFGISFSLGDIVNPGSLVFHDQHYYGISLRGQPIEIMFGVKRLELCYMPGQTRDQDRFRASFRLAMLDFMGSLRSGDIAIEWGVNWDFLLDFGFPWKSGAAYQWQRAFSLPMGTYEAKFGLYCEKRSQMAPSGATELTIGAGAGFYFGYYFGFGTPGRFVWVQAGIGIFAILEGTVTFEIPPNSDGGMSLIKGSLKEVMVRGVIGIYAYGEGGIEIWVISARFRVSVQAAVAGELHYLPGGHSSLRYAATLSASYAASCRVGCGMFSFTFSVSGTIEMQVSGQALLN